MTSSKLYTVQRLAPQTTPDIKTGFDKLFKLEYMGASEYEWGASGASLRRIRAAGPLTITEAPITIAGLERTVYIVSPRKLAAESVAALELWVTPETPLSAKVHSHFEEVFTGTQRERDQTHAWWDFGVDIAWALERDVAERLLTGFGPKE
jgi:hypothetical protein